MNLGGRLARPMIAKRPENGFVCWRCRTQARRGITQKYLARQETGRKEWQQQAQRIRDGEQQSMLSFLEGRGFVQDYAGGRKVVDNLMTVKRLGVYAGVDPTAPSLHVGHMLPFMMLFWMYLHGYHTVSLLGGSTARIGDPTGRTSDRNEMTSTERKANMASMHYQLKKLWVSVDRVGKKYGYEDDTHWKRGLVNNGVWWNKMSFIDVLKYMGKGIRLGPMLGKDTVKNKMESGDGMSFAEFCYPIMQSWDFWRMYDEKGIQMQIGGQDQFGNIVAGMDAVKFVARTHPDQDTRAPESGIKPDMMPIGLTVPLLTNANGEKFGKSAGNAIWLESQMTSVFDLYGFFVRTADADVKRYLKLFTFMPLNKIDSLCDKHRNDPSKRLAQHRLAREFVDLIHGEEAAQNASAQHAALFQKPTLQSVTNSASIQAKPEPEAQPTPEPQLTFNGHSPPSSDSQSSSPTMPPQSPTLPDAIPPNPLTTKNNNRLTRDRGTFLSRELNPFAPITSSHTPSAQSHVVLPKSLIHDQPIARVLYAAGLVSSRSEGHRLAAQAGAYIGHQSGVYGKEKGENTEMADQLTFTPAKLHDKSQTWGYVIKATESAEEAERQAREGEEGLLILRVGKWKMRVCRIVTDERFESMGLEAPPGWREVQSEKVRKKSMEAWMDIEEELVAGKKGVEPARRDQQREALAYLRGKGMSKEEVREAVREVWETAKRGGKKRREREEMAEQEREKEDVLDVFSGGVEGLKQGEKGV